MGIGGFEQMWSEREEGHSMPEALSVGYFIRHGLRLWRRPHSFTITHLATLHFAHWKIVWFCESANLACLVGSLKALH